MRAFPGTEHAIEMSWNFVVQQVTIVQMSSTTSSRSPTPILDLETPLPKGNPWDHLSVGRTVLVVVAILASAYLMLRVGFVLRENIPFAEHFFDGVVRDVDGFSLRAGSLVPLYLFLILYNQHFVYRCHPRRWSRCGRAVGRF
jgi:hypothetical protein